MCLHCGRETIFMNIIQFNLVSDCTVLITRKRYINEYTLFVFYS